MIRSAPQPVSLRISVTERCQLRCEYCMPPEGTAKRDRQEILSFEEITRFVRIARDRFGLSKVHLTGGEPLVRRGIVGLVKALAAEGDFDLALTTNGQLLSDMAAELKDAGLRRINISLDSLDAGTFSQLTRGGDLRNTLAGLEAALQCGFEPVKLNATVLRNVNTHEVERITRFAMDCRCEVRFLELMPIGPAAERFDEWSVPAEEVLAQLSAAFDVRPEPGRAGDPRRRYSVTDERGRKGRVGLISSVSDPFCSGCQRLRLTAPGQLVGCLALGEGVDIRPVLLDPSPGSEQRLAGAIDQALSRKRNGRGFTTRNLMARTGG